MSGARPGDSDLVPLFSFRSGHRICRVLSPEWIEDSFSAPGIRGIELLEGVRDWLVLGIAPRAQDQHHGRSVFAVVGPDGEAERFLSVSLSSHRIRVHPAFPGRGDPELACSICRWFSVETFDEPLFRCGDAKVVGHPLLILPEEGVLEVMEGASRERAGGPGVRFHGDERAGHYFLMSLLSRHGMDFESFLRTSGFDSNDFPGYSQIEGRSIKMYSWILENLGVMDPEAMVLSLSELRERLSPQILIPDDREVRTSLDLDMPWILPVEEFKKWLNESLS